MDPEILNLTEKAKQFTNDLGLLRDELKKVIVGQQVVIDRLLIALCADGHVLLEGVPGIAKTLTIRTLSQCIDCSFTRLQFTPDMLPSDIMGTKVYNQRDSSFSTMKGPIFASFVLADEINRAPVAPAPVTCQPKVVDYRKEAELLLREAEKQAGRQQYREAYGTAGQALRLFLSYRFGTGVELTNTEVIDLVTGSGREIAGIDHLLERCSLVGFAKAGPGPGEFVQFAETIRNILRAE